MNTSGVEPWNELRTRRSGRVALVLLGTAGAITAATAIHAWLESRRDDSDQASAPAAPPVSTAQTYTNNDFIPGVGYYHAPYHGWFPYPYNYHDGARGYYAGGLWHAAPFVLGLLRSQPSNDAVAAALAAQRAREQTQQRYQRGGGVSGFSGLNRSTGSTPSTARPTAAPASKPGSSSSRPAAPASGSHVSRGGFGSSGHSSGAS